MSVFLRTVEFDEWLKVLRDPIGKARILARIRAAELGHFGDHAAVGEGVYELRIPTGPGYRAYYWRHTGCCVAVTNRHSVATSVRPRPCAPHWRLSDEEARGI